MMNPANPRLLASNDAFAQLHDHLLTSLLTPNGQTTSLAKSVSRQETLETARRYCVQRAKINILRNTLKAVACDGSNSLNSALKERCLLVAAVLVKDHLRGEEKRLFGPDLEQFRSDLQFKDGVGVAQLLSQDLEERHDILYQMAAASRNASSSIKPVSLAAVLKESLSGLEELRNQTIPSLHANLAGSISRLLGLYREWIELQIQQLERHTHGIQIRFTKAQTEYLSAVSAGMAAKSRLLLLQTRQEIYGPEAQEALENYAGHLSIIEERLRERRQQLEDETRLFEEQGDRRMRECGRRYIAVAKDIEDVKAEIARLEPDTR